MILLIDLGLILVFMFLLPLYLYSIKVFLEDIGFFEYKIGNVIEKVIIRLVDIIESSFKNTPKIYNFSVRALNILFPVLLSTIVTLILLYITLFFLNLFDSINYDQLNNNVLKIPYNIIRNILENPEPVAFIAIIIYFLLHFQLYKWVIKKIKCILIKNFSDYEKNIEKNEKTAFNDFTALVALFGFLPMLIDSLFGTQNLSENMKNTVFTFFILIISPYIYLLYKN